MKHNISPDQPGRIPRERLDPYHYTISLIQEATRSGRMDQAAAEEIQVQLMDLLAELILRYNGGESTSLKTETAQRILLSILYSVDAGMRSLDDPEEGLSRLKTGKVKEVYKLGLDLIASCLEQTRQMYEEIVNNKLDIPNIAYHSTLNSLPDFFKHYDMIFSAHDTMADIDYPLLFDDMKIEGIFYIHQYLQKLAFETAFCRLFRLTDVKKLLSNYGRVYRINYREALINVFEIVLTNSIFAVLSDGRADVLRLSRVQYMQVKNQFARVDPVQCRRTIDQALLDLAAGLGIHQTEWRDYICKFTSVFLPRLLSALDNDCLDHVMILDEDMKTHVDIVLGEGKRMDDEKFRSLVDHILACPDREEKAAIIAANTHSACDFIDVLEADCLFGDEYAALFSILGEMELSMLARIVFADEIRTAPGKFSLAQEME